MLQPNPYEPPSKQIDSSRTTDTNCSLPYSYARGIATFFVSSLFLWFFVVPLIAPTDVAPEGAPPIPPHLVALQLLVGYGVPALLVYSDWRRYKSANKPA